MTKCSLMQVKSIADCSKGSILQYFWPALSNNWSWKPIFGFSESGHFTHVYTVSPDKQTGQPWWAWWPWTAHLNLSPRGTSVTQNEIIWANFSRWPYEEHVTLWIWLMRNICATYFLIFKKKVWYFMRIACQHALYVIFKKAAKL